MGRHDMRPRLPAHGSAQYVSDFERFMHSFLEQHPEVEEDRRRGWYIWWDHRVDPDDIDKLRKEELPFKPYD